MIYPRFLTGFSILIFFPNFKSHGISGQIFSLTYFFQSKRQLQVALDGKSSQEYPINAGVPQCSILGPHFSYCTSMTLMLSVILLSMMMILLYCKCDQASDLWQQLSLTSKPESDL